MLSLKNIVKQYPAGDGVVEALSGVSLDFRKSEFVSILGPSGCGKTTLLNIIGGLDRYTSGDLVIRKKSTKEYKDRDWDNYRNHSVGFVFQSYNLIPHQSALSNVELALTLSGVSKAERRKRAKKALERVGLADQLSKKPAQMSGGQAQRVAIARALVNDPEIILADEPTGALDSETSVQIMEILKEISHDRLIIMVTHNPELAEAYSTRIIRLMDGKVTHDSAPYQEGEEEKETYVSHRKPSMSFFTALGLSLNNLMTKKARTFLTSFAGSIGIIGIALIMAISQGVNAYIRRVQEDTLSSYPIQIEAESVDMSAMISTMMGLREEQENPTHEKDAVYSSPIMYELMNSLNSMETTKNNLKDFKTYLESKKELTDRYTSAVEYTYDLDFHIYTKDPAGKIVKSDVLQMMTELYGGSFGMMSSSGMMSGAASESLAAFEVWEQMLPGRADEEGKVQVVNPLLKEQYDLVSGHWPESENELVLIVNQNNEVSDFVLYALGLKSLEEMKADLETVAKGERLDVKENRWTYEFLQNKEFKLVLSADRFSFNPSSQTYTDLSATEAGLNLLYNGENTITLKISGIVAPNADATATMLTGSIGYTAALTDKIMAMTAQSKILKDQMANTTVDVITGLPFKDTVTELSDEEKIEKAKEYIAALKEADKAALYVELMSILPQEMLDQQLASTFADHTREELEQSIVEAYVAQTGAEDRQAVEEAVRSMSEEDFRSAVTQMVTQMVSQSYAQTVAQQLGALPQNQLAAMLDAQPLADGQLLYVYEEKVPSAVSDSTYEENLKHLGFVDPDSPSGVNIYSATFDHKEKIADLIREYNQGVSEEDVINYTDYVALMMSGISTIINAISYVLMAFVSVSLVVSSIMIGIITYISVLERTKEIGILRAIGASKRDISGVFNAETFLVGLCAGVIGIGFTLLLLIPINAVIHAVTDIAILNAFLPWEVALILVALSMALTIIAGFFPAKIAAKKDPVVALRSE